MSSFLRGQGSVIGREPVRLSLDRLGFGIPLDGSLEGTQLGGGVQTAAVVVLCVDARRFAAHERRLAFVREVAAVGLVGAGIFQEVDADEGALWVVWRAVLDDVKLVVEARDPADGRIGRRLPAQAASVWERPKLRTMPD
jgi:hypothetical protein